MTAVAIDGLQKRFGGHAVVEGFDLHVEDGEFVVLLGPSGCGKTTVLRCVSGLVRPDAGRIQIDGKIVDDATARISVPPQKREIGLVFQTYALWPHLSVWENIAYPLRVRHTASNDLKRKVSDVLSLVGLEQHGRRYPAELSGGQQQRVALARAIVASPRVLLMDEPLSNLDAQRRQHLRRMLREIHQEIRTTTIYVTHDQIEALTMADRVLVMRNGHIEQSGTPLEVFRHPKNSFVAKFLGYENAFSGTVTATDGRTLSVQSDAWETALLAENTAGWPVNARIELTFRAINVSLHPNSPELGANTKRMQIRDVTFLGDCFEYVLQSGSHRVIARQPSKGGRADYTLGSTLLVSIAPQDLVVLPSANHDDTSACRPR